MRKYTHTADTEKDPQQSRGVAWKFEVQLLFEGWLLLFFYKSLKNHPPLIWVDWLKKDWLSDWTTAVVCVLIKSWTWVSISAGATGRGEIPQGLRLQLQGFFCPQVKRVRKKPVSWKFNLFITKSWSLSFSVCLSGSLTASPLEQSRALRKRIVIHLSENRHLARTSNLRKEQKKMVMHMHTGDVESVYCWCGKYTS